MRRVYSIFESLVPWYSLSLPVCKAPSCVLYHFLHWREIRVNVFPFWGTLTILHHVTVIKVSIIFGMSLRLAFHIEAFDLPATHLHIALIPREALFSHRYNKPVSQSTSSAIRPGPTNLLTQQPHGAPLCSRNTSFWTAWLRGSSVSFACFLSQTHMWGFHCHSFTWSLISIKEISFVFRTVFALSGQ